MLADLPTAPWFRRVLVAALILGIVLLTFSVLRPFLVPLIWGGILAYVSWPLQQRITRALRGRSGLAALLTTLLVTLALDEPPGVGLKTIRIEAFVAIRAARASVGRCVGAGHADAAVGRSNSD